MRLVKILESKGYDVFESGDFFEVVIGTDVIYIDKVDADDFFRLEMEYINKRKHFNQITRHALNEVLEELNKGEC